MVTLMFQSFDFYFSYWIQTRS